MPALKDKIIKKSWVLHVDDETGIGNGIIVTLADGWAFVADPDCGVRGFDTWTEALVGTSKSSVLKK